MTPSTDYGYTGLPTEGDLYPHDLFSLYLAYVKTRRQPLTHASYESDLKIFRVFLKEADILPRKREIGPRLLDAYLSWMKDRQFAKATIERRLQVLKSFFQWAVHRQHLRDNPFLWWDLPRAPDPLPRALSPEEDMRFLALLNQQPSRRFERMVIIGFRMARFAGFRRSDCNGMRWENTDLIKGTFRVIGGKGDKDRAVPMPDAGLKTPLVHWWEENGRPDSGYVLTGLAHRGLQPKALSQSIRRYFRAARIAGATFKTLRTTFASRLAEKGVPVPVIASLLGHADVRTTMRYIEIVELQKRQAVQRLDEDIS